MTGTQKRIPTAGEIDNRPVRTALFELEQSDGVGLILSEFLGYDEPPFAGWW